MNEPRESNVVGHMIPVSGLLAGFSFAALVELITVGEAKTITTVTIIFSLLSSLLYILALFGFVATTSIPGHSPQAKSTAASVEWVAFLVFWLATLGLLATVAVAGWIHSPLVGIVGTVVALLVIVLLIVLLVVRARVL